MTAIAEAGLSLGDAIGSALRLQSEQRERLNNFARRVAASKLAADVSGILDAERDAVWDSLTHVPDNMLTLLESPQGWSVLASYVAEDFGRVLHSYSPTVH